MEDSRWYKVDNVANVFLATYNRRDTRTLRVSCTLNETVNQQLLQAALEQTVMERPQFQVRIRRGFFWHYIESTDAVETVKEESGRPCPMLYGPEYKGILHYKVSYFNNRINLDLFHALSDGTGALDFLNVLVLNYLKLAHKNEITDITVKTKGTASDREQNSYKHFAENSGKNIVSNAFALETTEKKAYHIQGGRLSYNQIQFFEIHMSGKAFIAQAKKYHVGLTSFLGALLMTAISEDMPSKQKKKPVTISIPVNLRNYYPSDTIRNFFNNVNVSHVFKGDETLERLCLEFEEKLKLNLTHERIKEQMNKYEQFEEIFFTRMVPLAIKQPVVRFFAKNENKRVSAVISNLGKMTPEEEIKPYIKGYSAFCSHDELFTTVSSYGDDMVMGVSLAYQNTGVLRDFVSKLRQMDIPVTVYASEVIK